jgi:ribosomal protein L40E
MKKQLEEWNKINKERVAKGQKPIKFCRTCFAESPMHAKKGCKGAHR